MDKAYLPQEFEQKWRDFWKRFHAPISGQESYTIILPPPNVTGVLHMGHALDNTLQDILIRKKRMEGYKTLFLPGTDHAGIATQSVVEKTLYSQSGKTRNDFSRQEFLEEIWRFTKEKEGAIISQLQMMGSSLDWSRKRFTMDEGSSKAVFTCFKQLFDQGYIYRGSYLVNWDPVLQTALSDDEVEYEEKDSFLWYFNYPLHGSEESLVIATTRPETMLGDVAVAVHPEDSRFQSCIGKKIALPLTDRQIPIIADEHVDPDFGSGCVKITPAHDFNDYEIGKRHDLPFINILTKDAKINENGGSFQGLSALDARQAVVDAMDKKGLLLKKEAHKLS